MDIQRVKREAEEFQKPRHAYIHTEIKDGVPMTVICGDTQAMLWGIVAEIDRISFKVGEEFNDTLCMLAGLKLCGYETLTRGQNHDEFDVIEGEDWAKKWKEQTQTELEKTASIEVANMKVDLRNSQKECEKLRKRIDFINAQLKCEKEKNLSCGKEINRLNADIRRMERDNNGAH